MSGDWETGGGSREGVDPRRLLIFREVARRGSLSAAADALGWTQPAVGQHVQRLEREVGLQLVLRSHRGVVLTEAGTALLEHADALASRLSAAQEAMRAIRTLQTGRLRLGAFPSACATLVPGAMALLAQRAPDLDIRISECEPPEARAAVLSGDVDLVVLFTHPGIDDHDEHPDLHIRPLFDDPIFAILPKMSHWADAATQGSELDLSELAKERWIAGCVRCRAHLHRLASASGFQPDVRHTSDDYVVVQNLVATGLVVALLPALALEASRDQRVTALPLIGHPVRTISVACRREARSLPAVDAGMQAFVEAGSVQSKAVWWTSSQKVAVQT